MKINIDNQEFNISLDEEKLNRNFSPVIFLHGFSGNSKDWNFLKTSLPHNFHIIAIDLIGHGESSSPAELKYYTTERIIAQLKDIFDHLKIDCFCLIGYSMGGRAALAFTIKYPQRVTKLLLESTSIGLENKEERALRIQTDMLLADRIENGDFDSFFNYWYNLPLFTTLKENKNIDFDLFLKEKIKSNNKMGLANILRGFGAGKMPNYWNDIKNITNEVLFLSGKNDEKFTEIGIKVKAVFPNFIHKIVPECGHNVHLEKPEDFIKFLNEFLVS